MIHVDTNFLIQALLSGSSSAAKFQTWLTNGEDVGISTIAWSEFLCGPLTSADAALAERLFGGPEPFFATDARKAAELFNLTGRRSRSLADCQIAAVALRCNARMATSNTSDFALFSKSRINSGLNGL